MNFFKFFKFSKLLSACVSFGILFSGFQTSGMERRLNFDMLGKDTVASTLDGIEVKIPEHCEFCGQKVCRYVAYGGDNISYICKNNDCLQKCHDKLLNLNGLKPRKLDIDNIHRCDAFKENMENIEKFKKLNYELPGVEKEFIEQCKQECARWKRYIKDKFADETFMACGHTICRCGRCCSEIRRVFSQTGVYKLVCPKCKARFDCKEIMSVVPICDVVCNEAAMNYNKSQQLIERKLNNEWRDGVIYLSSDKNINVANSLCMDFCKRGKFEFEFDEDRFKKVDAIISLGKKILFLDDTAFIGKRFRFLEISKLDDCIKALIKYDKYKDIVYPVKGKLHDKIKEIKFIEDNAITISKELHNICSDKAAGEVYNKMLEDNVE